MSFVVSTGFFICIKKYFKLPFLSIRIQNKEKNVQIISHEPEQATVIGQPPGTPPPLGTRYKGQEGAKGTDGQGTLRRTKGKDDRT